MIRNVIIHVSNEQPLLADLFGVPNAADVGLVCTNMRTMDGKRPIFINSSAGTFFFPYLHIRFVEIAPGAIERHIAETGETAGDSAAPSTAAAGHPAGAVPETAPSGTGGGSDDPSTRLPVLVTDPVDAEPRAGELELDLDIDEDFLRRVRDI